MRAAVLLKSGGEELDVFDDIETLPLGPADVKVDIKATGVCHSDLHAINGDLPQGVPFVPGHEGAGVVTEVGPAVTSLAVGDHVVVAWSPPCGQCTACVDQKSPHLCVMIQFAIAGSAQVQAGRHADLRHGRHRHVRRGDGRARAGRHQDRRRRALRDRLAHRLWRDHGRGRRHQHGQGRRRARRAWCSAAAASASRSSRVVGWPARP